MNSKINIAFLFDMDGVIVDTEPIYSEFWRKVAISNNLDVNSFIHKVKGRTISDIVNQLLTGLSEHSINKVLNDLEVFERTVDFPEIPGVLDFICKAKSCGIRVALVTSSSQMKLNRVIREKCITGLFDTIVSGIDVRNSKPAPDCYLIGASRLNVKIENCYVFEDSLAGISSGNSAKMSVIGVASTYQEDELKHLCKKTITNFINLKINDIIQI